jgi:hypothetical protein
MVSDIKFSGFWWVDYYLSHGLLHKLQYLKPESVVYQCTNLAYMEYLCQKSLNLEISFITPVR